MMDMITAGDKGGGGGGGGGATPFTLTSKLTPL